VTSIARLTLALLLTTAPIAASAQPAQPWTNRALSAEARADLLVRAMTQDEKLLIVHGHHVPHPRMFDGVAVVAQAGYVPGVSRLGIPALRESDASLGVANQVEQRKGDVATALPSGLATAASFDPAIAYAGGRMAGAEARAKTFNVLLAGGVNLTRDPLNGRNFEYMGEDPLLAGTMAGAAIAGVQSNHIVSTVKHFALNAQETGRHILDARLGDVPLRESDLLAFEIAIEKGRPGSVMCAYNQLNGNYTCESHYLLTDVLRRDWGYKGWTMSDWGALHSTVKGALAGLDQESGQELDTQAFFGAPLARAVADGQVPQARLDDMVRHILTGMIANGLMDDPVPDRPVPIDYAAHADVAQRAAEAGMVLLKNDREMLPFAKTARTIVLIGGHADVGVLSGGGSSQVRSVGGVPVELMPPAGSEPAGFARITWHNSSPMAAIRAAAPGATVTYIDGRDPAAAAAAARNADLTIVFAWQWQTEAMDAETLALPENQDATIDAVAAANPRTLVVLETGGPVLMPWLAKVPAVLEAWYPGQRGGPAIARALFGDIDPGGRLPMTFPASVAQTPRPAVVGMDLLHAADAKRAAGASDVGGSGQVPPFAVEYPEGANVGYRWFSARGERPLFAFGYGLSYANFRYSDVHAHGGPTPTVDFTVTNTGARAGADVPQVYVRSEAGASRAIRLGGWSKVLLQPGESRHVSVTIEPRVIAAFDPALHGWRRAGGKYTVTVARSAEDRGTETIMDLAPQSLRP